ncbi:MAG: hypothetical protein RL088_3388 [Verrucomicrobiota bacterium]|jgi:hypothetical protein
MSVCIIALLAIGLVVVSGSRPAMPSQWHLLRAGMPRAEVLAILRDEVIDMRELKGFDVTSHETTMLGSSSYWQLLITYDASGRVSTAEAHFIHRDCGLFNKKRESVL